MLAAIHLSPMPRSYLHVYIQRPVKLFAGVKQDTDTMSSQTMQTLSFGQSLCECEMTDRRALLVYKNDLCYMQPIRRLKHAMPGAR